MTHQGGDTNAASAIANPVPICQSSEMSRHRSSQHEHSVCNDPQSAVGYGEILSRAVIPVLDHADMQRKNENILKHSNYRELSGRLALPPLTPLKVEVEDIQGSVEHGDQDNDHESNSLSTDHSACGGSGSNKEPHRQRHHSTIGPPTPRSFEGKTENAIQKYD